MDNEQNIEELIEQLESENNEERMIAYHTLAELGTLTLKPLLSALRHHTNPKVRSDAAVLIGSTRAIDAVDELINALADKDSRVQRNAVYALGLIGDERAIGPLIAALYADADKQFAESQTKDEEYTDEPDAEGDEYIQVATRADYFSRSHIRALAAIGGVKVIEPLIEAIHSDDVKVFDPAYYGLIEIGTPAVEPLITELKTSKRTLNNKDRLVDLLREIGDPRAFEAIFAVIEDEDVLVRHSAVLALADFKDKRVVPRLTEIAQFSEMSGCVEVRL